MHTRPTGGETSPENLEVGGYGNVVLLMLIVVFHHVIIDDEDVTDVQGVGIQETMEGLVVTEFFDLGLVETLPELAPHGIEHHCGQRAETRIVLDLVILQTDALVLLILADVLLVFGLVVAFPLGPTADCLCDFEQGVHVVLEEALAGLGEMPHLLHVLNLVTKGNGFLQFGVHHVPVRARLGVSPFRLARRWRREKR